MKKLFILSMVVTTLWSCNPTDKKKDSVSKEEKPEHVSSDFELYISTLDKIPIPLMTNPLGKLPEISKNFDQKGFEKYKHTWTSHPLGIYYRNDMTVGIIDCSIGDWGLVPFLTTYDLNGNKIDSTSFYKKSGQDMGYEAIEHLTFKENNSIVVIDTVKRWDFNEDESDIVEGSMKMTTGKVEYQILESGQIQIK